MHRAGDAPGKGPGIEHNGNQIAFTGLAMARIQNGQILDAWNSFGFPNFYERIGLLKSSMSA